MSLGRPKVAMGVAVVLALLAYSVLAHLVTSPRIFTDELAYWDSAAALMDGQLLTARGERYVVGPLYPGLLAAVLSLSPDRETAYEIAKLLNALLFSLAAIPIYLLARRVLRPWPSVGVAVLGVLVPSAMYVSVIMTESVAYVTFVCALLSVALALERPTAGRQVMALAAIGLACSARLQFLVLVPVYLLGFALTLAVGGKGGRTTSRSRLVELWPTLLASGVAITALVAWGVLSKAWAPDLVGDYSTLWRGYDPVAVGGWLGYHLANLELYVAVVPFAVAPIVLESFVRRGRAGSSRHAAFVALFVSVNAAIVLLAAAFNSTEYGHGRLHDRYTFYLAPLWLILLFVWLQDRAPRPLVAGAVGISLALVLPVFIPFSDYAREDGAQRFAGVASTLWAAIQTAAAGTAFVWGEVVLFSFVALLVAAAFLVPRRHVAGVAVGAVAVTFVTTAQLAWYLAIRDGTHWAFANTPAGPEWVDERVPTGRSVTSLTVGYPCESGLVGGDAIHRTEFFNERLSRAVHVGPKQTHLPSTKVYKAPDGVLRFGSGEPFVADFVLTQDGVLVNGRLTARGTISHLSLWEVGGQVRLVGRAPGPDCFG